MDILFRTFLDFSASLHYLYLAHYLHCSSSCLFIPSSHLTPTLPRSCAGLLFRIFLEEPTPPSPTSYSHQRLLLSSPSFISFILRLLLPLLVVYFLWLCVDILFRTFTRYIPSRLFSKSFLGNLHFPLHQSLYRYASCSQQSWNYQL